MVITLNADYDVALSTALLGYVGETNARPVTVEGMEVDGADRYIMTIDYGDGVVYDVDISGGTWTPTADILRAAQTVSCQISARKYDNGSYTLVKKSKIFSMRIGQALSDGVAPIPSPSVAADALDRMTALGGRITADVQTAVTAAETATTAADNAAKSATNAGVSADTATQAASRAETAQTVAETSATQAETAMQSAETARTQAVTQANAAKISADLAANAAQQTTADKTATAGYAETAKTAADSAAADRQAVQKMATQVTADKATVADNAAQVATDRKAAETAAQTAQAVADSLPDDYVAAVAKIAENTAEIGRVKLTDKELQRRVDALYDIGQGITHRFETDSSTAYAKTVPTGGKLMSVKSVGGRSIVWNQLTEVKARVEKVTSSFYIEALLGSNRPKYVKRHKYFLKFYAKSDVQPFLVTTGYSNDKTIPYSLDGIGYTNCTSGWQKFIFTPNEKSIDKNPYFALRPIRYTNNTTFNYEFRDLMLIDLTLMFGTGNEPATVAEFEKMFPAEYYPYNAGKIISGAISEMVEQGKNLFDYTDPAYHGANVARIENGIIYGGASTTAVLNIPVAIGNTYVLSFKVKSNGTNTAGLRWALLPGKNAIYTNANNTIGIRTGFAANTEYAEKIKFTAKTDYVSLTTIVSMVYDVQLEMNDSATDYAPYHIISHNIPDEIRNLPGYGVEENTADYEAKTYTQNNTVDGTEIKALATPIVTDISDLIPDDFLRNIEVEAGGSVTFKNSNDNYRIPVPSEEEYIVKLSEIGGSV